MSGLPKTIAGTPVAFWWDATFTARCFNTSTRTLRNWEGVGLPWAKRGRSRVYPWPHTFAWAVVFAWRGSNLTTYLPVDIARGEYERGARRE